MQWSCENGHNFLSQGTQEETMKEMERGCPICQKAAQQSQNEELATLIAEKVAEALKPYLPIDKTSIAYMQANPGEFQDNH